MLSTLCPTGMVEVTWLRIYNSSGCNWVYRIRHLEHTYKTHQIWRSFYFIVASSALILSRRINLRVYYISVNGLSWYLELKYGFWIKTTVQKLFSFFNFNYLASSERRRHKRKKKRKEKERERENLSKFYKWALTKHWEEDINNMYKEFFQFSTTFSHQSERRRVTVQNLTWLTN